MITEILLWILIILIIWTTMTYLKKSFVQKYEEAIDLVCIVCIDTYLFTHDVSIWICLVLAIISVAFGFYTIYYPPQKIPIITLASFCENFIVSGIPYMISKLFHTSYERSYVIALLAFLAFLALGCFYFFLKMRKKNKNIIKSLLRKISQDFT